MAQPFFFFFKISTHIPLLHVETDSPEDACGDDCLNRVLMMEWFVADYPQLHNIKFSLPPLFFFVWLYNLTVVLGALRVSTAEIGGSRRYVTVGSVHMLMYECTWHTGTICRRGGVQNREEGVGLKSQGKD